MNGHPQDGGVPAIRLRHGAGTDRGLRRQLNEDALVVRPGLFAVADGMGGHEAGEVASRICVETLGAAHLTGHTVLNAPALQELMELADAKIRVAGESRAGTTVSGAALVQESGVPYWLVFNVGDSRTYRLSQGLLAQISVDHSEVQEMVDRGEITAAEALVHPRRHVITRALGTGDDSEPDFWLVPVADGDRIMICSDGLTSEVSDDQIHRILSKVHDPQDAVDSLIQAALRSGGRDNISIIVVDAESADAEHGTTAPRTAPIEVAATLPREDPVPGPLATDTPATDTPATDTTGGQNA